MLVPGAFVCSTVAAYFVFFLSYALDGIQIRWAVAAHLNFPPSDLLHLVDLIAIFFTFAIWVVPVACAVGFAMKVRLSLAILWGISISLLLTAAFVWFAREPFSRLFVVIASMVLICGAIYFIARKARVRTFMLVNLAALVLLFVPALIVLVSLLKQPPLAHKVWSVVLPLGTGQPTGNETEVNLGDFLAITGDRVIFLDAMPGGHEGLQPMTGYRLVSLDRNTGAIRNQINISEKSGEIPSVFATKSGQIALINADSVALLNSDLNATGIERGYPGGKISEISPDGSTLGLTTRQLTTLLTASKLEPVSEIPGTSGSELITSISPEELLNIDLVQNRKSFGNKVTSAVNLVNGGGAHELFRNDCLPPGHFLSSDRVLIAGCGRIRILDTRGKLLEETRNAGTGGLFAGVSQAGNRFALEYNDERGDPLVLLYDQFVIYDAITLKPLASVSVDDLPERQSWSGFSPDGHFFAVGNPDKLTLYEVP